MDPAKGLLQSGYMAIFVILVIFVAFVVFVTSSTS
jgi:hypothetical protein